MASKYDPETRAKAVRLVLDHRDDYPSEWAAITAVSKRLGMNAETLRNWIRHQQVDDGNRDGVSSEAAAEIRALKRRNAELGEHHLAEQIFSIADSGQPGEVGGAVPPMGSHGRLTRVDSPHGRSAPRSGSRAVAASAGGL